MTRDVAQLGAEFGFANETEFIRGAVRDKILELKKLLFIQISTRVKSGLKEKGITEADLLKEFKEWRKKHS